MSRWKEDEDKGFLVEDATVVRTTLRALLIKAAQFDEDVWVPRSQVRSESDISEDADEGDTGDLVVTAWFANQKEWL